MSGQGPQIALEDEESFEAIEQAVMETARGRWFLAEFAARSRRADTKALIQSLAELERAFAGATALAVTTNLTEDIARLDKDIGKLAAIVSGHDDPDNTQNLARLARDSERQAIALAVAADRIRDHLVHITSGSNGTYPIADLDQDLTQLITSASEQAGAARRFAALAEVLRHIRERLAALHGMADRPPPGDPQIGPAANDAFPSERDRALSTARDIVA
jgi:hypothetical protein